MAIDTFMEILLGTILCIVFGGWVAKLNKTSKFIESYQMATFHIIRCGDAFYGNKVYITDVKAHSAEEALNRFALRRGYANYEEMERLGVFPGITYEALEKTL